MIAATCQHGFGASAVAGGQYQQKQRQQPEPMQQGLKLTYPSPCSSCCWVVPSASTARAAGRSCSSRGYCSSRSSNSNSSRSSNNTRTSRRIVDVEAESAKSLPLRRRWQWRSRLCAFAADGSKSAQTLQQLKEQGSALADDLKGTSIFLVGMMGSGKSTVGRVLAEALGYYFFDSDEVVQQAAGGAPIAQIFEENGEDAFRDIETRVLSELSSLGRLVVATGGGSVLRPSNWSYISHGVTVFLEVPVDVLASRVVTAGLKSRPLLSQQLSADGLGGSSGDSADQDEELVEAVKRLQRIYSERESLYRNADSIASLSALSQELGCAADDITSEDIALQVLRNIGQMVEERKEKDRALQRAGA